MDQYRIVITPQRIAQLKSAYAAEFGTVDSDNMLPKLIDDYVTSEVLVREAKARGLERDDEIIRRRLIQKIQFLEEDMDNPPKPSEADLRGWYDRHKARYAQAGRVSFSHIFFAADAANAPHVRRQAATLLAALPATTSRAPELGDSFPDQSDFADFGPEQAQRLFGAGEMADALFKAPLGKWAGPYRSAFGWHLVRVSAKQPGGVPQFENIRNDVARDYAEATRSAQNTKRLAALRARYQVVRE